MPFKTLNVGIGRATYQPVPGAATSGVAQPLPPDGSLPGAITSSTSRFTTAQASKQPAGSKRRGSGVVAAMAGRRPVQGTRSQDRRPDANDGVPLTVENGVPVVHPGSTLR